MRADSGFFSWDLVKILDRHHVAWSITVPQNAGVRKAIAAIDEHRWVDITYPDGGRAQVAETSYVTGGDKSKRAKRSVSSCAAPGSPTLSRPSCGPTGATTPS